MTHPLHPVRIGVASSSFRQIPTHRRKLTRIQSSEQHFRLRPPTELYVFNAQLDDGPHDVASLFPKPTCCVRILIGVLSNALLTVESLFDMGTGPNLINKYFQNPGQKQLHKLFKAPQLWMANGEVLNIKCIVPQFIRIWDKCIHASFGIVENFAVHILLGKSIINRCISRVLATERKIVPWLLRQVQINRKRMEIN